MATFTTANGLTTKLMALESIVILTELNMKGTGKKINNMEMAWKHGQMAQNMKGNMFKAKNTELDVLPGLMEVHIMASL